jgi:hypothetical protein
MISMYKLVAKYYVGEGQYSQALQTWRKIKNTAKDQETLRTADRKIQVLREQKKKYGGSWGLMTWVLLAGGGLLVLLGGAAGYLFIFIPYFSRDEVRDTGTYNLKTVETEQEEEDYYQLLRQNYAHKIGPDHRDNFMEGTKERYEKWDERTTRIIGYHGGKPVCTFYIVESDPGGKGYVFDPEKKVDLGELESHGKVLEVGRFAIDDEYRRKPDLMTALFGFMIEKAMKKRAVFLLTCLLSRDKTMRAINQKIGFKKMEKISLRDEVWGVDKDLWCLNLLELFEIHNEKGGRTKYSVRPTIVYPYVWSFMLTGKYWRTKDLDFTRMGSTND